MSFILGHRLKLPIKGCESSNLAAAVFKINDCTSAELVPVRILNTSDKVQIISAQTVVPVTKPLTSVVELEVPKQTSDIPKIAVRKIHEGGDKSEETLPDPLNERWQRSSEQLTDEESQAVAEVLHRHKDVFSLSEQHRLLWETRDVSNSIPTAPHLQTV